MADAHEDEYSEEEYEEDDFEEEEEDEELNESEDKPAADKAAIGASSTAKRSGTPHKKKGESVDDVKGDRSDAIDGLDLENYMKGLKDPMEGDDADDLAEDLAAELKPLDGMKPSSDCAEQKELRDRLGYGEDSASTSGIDFAANNISNYQTSPNSAHNTVLGVMELSKKKSSSNNSNGNLLSGDGKQDPSISTGKNDSSSHSSSPSKQDDEQEHPSTRTSKSSAKSPVATAQCSRKKSKPKKEDEFMSEIDRYLINLHGESNSPEKEATQSAKVNFSSQASVIAAAVAESSKKFLLEEDESRPSAESDSATSSSSQQQQQQQLQRKNHDGVGFESEHLRKSKARSEEADRENAERVDALLMELFPERYEGKNKKVHLGGNAKKPPQGKGKKAAAGGYKKEQQYGLGARVDQDDSEGMLRSSSHAAVASQQYAHRSASPLIGDQSEGDDAGGALNSLDLQIRRLKKELRNKDDKIKRITDHAIMMANHMDKLKGEAAVLRSNLHKAHMVIEAKDARIDELNKRKKKVVVRRVRVAAEGNDPDIAALQSDNQRLREREQALVEALEDMSAQNEDLIMKLKDSMERELELSSKRAAQVNHQLPHIMGKLGSVSAGSDGKDSGRRQRDAEFRARSEPIDEHAVPRRTRKKK